MRFDVVTIFPQMFRPVLEYGVLGRAVRNGLISVHLHQLRDYTADKHRKVDDRPYGGGPGMIMRPEPVVAAVESVAQEGGRVLITSPQGKLFDQPFARELASAPQLVIIAGRYGGYDERIIELTGAEEVSIGDFVLSGGELAALVIMEATGRLLEGVLGCEESVDADSFADGLLAGPSYTRPEEFRDLGVPEVLLSGDHQAVRRYRRKQAEKRTAQRRPDLLKEPPNGDK